MLRSRRFALIAATLVLGLSACGDLPPSTNAGTVAAAKPAVIHLGTAKQRADSSASGAPVSGEAMMPIRDLHYLFDGSVPAMPGTAVAWTLPAGAVPADADIVRLATALGVKGDVRHQTADMGGGWVVGPTDFSGPTLNVTNDGLLSWGYNGNNSAVSGVSCGQAGSGSAPSSGSASTPVSVVPVSVVPVSVVPDSVPPVSVAPPCAQPTPPANVPDKAAAEAKATALMIQMGYDPSQFSFESTVDQWNANVAAVRMLGGVRSALQVDIDFGGDGVVQWASGMLAAPTTSSSYPLVSVADGVKRLNDHTGRWLIYGTGFGGPKAMAADSVWRATVGGSATASPPNSAVVEPAPLPPTTGSPTPGSSVAPPAPVDVHLTKVTLGLTFVWAQDGTVWLLPAYVFADATNAQYVVIAVDEAFLDTSITGPITTNPITTSPVTTTVVVHPTLGTRPPGTGDSVPTLPNPISLDDAKQLAGLTLDQATVLATQKGWTVRVAVKDGVNLALTADYSPTRVNVSTKGDMVVDIVSIG